MAVFGCDSDTVKSVDISEYSQVGECWIDKNGVFHSFVILLDVEPDKVMPLFISYKCVDKNDNGDPFIFLDNLRALSVSNRDTELDFGPLGKKKVFNNATSDLARPGSRSEVYAFSGIITTDADGNNNVDRVYFIKKTGFTLDHFLKLDKNQRYKIFISFISD